MVAGLELWFTVGAHHKRRRSIRQIFERMLTSQLDHPAWPSEPQCLFSLRNVAPRGLDSVLIECVQSQEPRPFWVACRVFHPLDVHPETHKDSLS